MENLDKTHLNQLQTEREQVQQINEQLRTERERNEQLSQQANDQLRIERERCDQLTRRITELETNINANKNWSNQISEQVSILEKERKRLEDKLADAKKQRVVSDHLQIQTAESAEASKKRVGLLEQRLVEEHETLTAIKNEYHDLQQRVQELSQREKKLLDELNEHRTVCSNKGHEVIVVRNQLEALRKELEEVRKENEGNKSRLEIGYKQRMDIKQREVDALKREKDTIQAELIQLRTLLETAQKSLANKETQLESACSRSEDLQVRVQLLEAQVNSFQESRDPKFRMSSEKFSTGVKTAVRSLSQKTLSDAERLKYTNALFFMIEKREIDLVQTLSELEAKNSSLLNDLRIKDDQNSALAADLKNEDARNSNLVKEINILTAKLQRMQENLDSYVAIAAEHDQLLKDLGNGNIRR